MVALFSFALSDIVSAADDTGDAVTEAEAANGDEDDEAPTERAAEST
jgi:hypothetical protein